MARLAAMAIIAAAIAVASPGGAQQFQGAGVPVVLRADEVSYDQEIGVVRATGNVEASQGDRVLTADAITYNERTDTVTAQGNVVLLEPTGEVLFADYVELRDEFKNGVITGIRVRLTDNSRLAANEARRSDGNRTEMSKAVYSPCESCRENPQRPLLWQLKANRVIHNQQAQRIDYYDAFLEVFGVPVAYTPFFSHPDPTVDRQTGFLVPDYGSSSDLGLMLRVPYYFNITPSMDATFAPLFTSKEGVVLAGEYRQRLAQGSFEFSGSITRPKERDINGERLATRDTRGHIFGMGRFQVDPTWRWGFDLARSTDDTYLRRYEILNDDTLTSDIFVEGFRGRNYFNASAYSFQGLRDDDDPGLTPSIWPIVDYNFVSEPTRLGSRYHLDVNLLQLTRTEGTDSRRLSVNTGWQLPYVAPAGDVYTLSANLRGDIYLVNGLARPGRAAGDSFSGVTGRFHPRLALDWRYPFVREQGTVRQVIEPLASVVLSPFEANPDEIPNEDSVSFEFDDTNLFSHDRFPGLDRVEGGPHFNVGLKAGVYGASGGSTTLIFGQTFRTRDNDTFPQRSGLETTRSDYVGRLTITPNEYFQYNHRFRLDRDDFGFRRNEIDLAMGPDRARLNFGFVELSRDLSADEAQSRRELRASGRIKLTEFWSANGSWRRDLSQNGGTISAGVGISYEDECIIFTSSFRRDFTRDRDIKPSTSINFRIALKHLG
jgi:LPS-assembly protein